MSPSSEEFTIGNLFRAFAAACTKNGVTVSLTPDLFEFGLLFFAGFQNRVQSTSKNVVT